MKENLFIEGIHEALEIPELSFHFMEKRDKTI